MAVGDVVTISGRRVIVRTSRWIPDVEKLRSGGEFPSESFLWEVNREIYKNFNRDGASKVRYVTIAMHGRVVTWDTRTAEVTSEAEPGEVAQDHRKGRRAALADDSEGHHPAGRYIGLDRGTELRDSGDEA